VLNIYFAKMPTNIFVFCFKCAGLNLGNTLPHDTKPNICSNTCQTKYLPQHMFCKFPVRATKHATFKEGVFSTNKQCCGAEAVRTAYCVILVEPEPQREADLNPTALKSTAFSTHKYKY
jgi:hypothetical protein